MSSNNLVETIISLFYWPFGSSVTLSPLQLWFHFFYNGFFTTVAVAFVVGPLLMGCAAVAILAFHRIGPIRKLLGIVLLVTLVPLLYPPMVVGLSFLLWLAISIFGVVFVYLGPAAIILGLTKTLMDDTINFWAKERQKKACHQYSTKRQHQEITILQILMAMLVAPISLLSTGVVILLLSVPRAPFIISNLYLLAVVRMWQRWKRSAYEVFFMATELNISRIVLLLDHIGLLVLWFLSVVLGFPIIAVGVITVVVVLVLAAALWPAHVASVAVKRPSHVGHSSSSSSAEILSASCQDAFSTKAVYHGAVYGSIAANDDDEMIDPVLMEENLKHYRDDDIKQRKAIIIATITKSIQSFPSLLRRFGSSFHLSLVASYQLIYVCAVLCNSGMKSWWDPHLSRRAVIELWQFITGEDGRLQWSRRMASDMTSMTQPSVMGLLKTRQCCGWEVHDWQPHWTQLVQAHGSNIGKDEWESVWNGFWYQMNVAQKEAMMARQWLTREHIMTCPTSIMMGLPSVVMLQYCLRSVYKHVPLTDLLVTTRMGETIGSLILTEANRPKHFEIVDLVWACLLEARKGCQEYIAGNDGSIFAVDHQVLVLCSRCEPTATTDDDLVVWNGGAAMQLDPTEPLHKLFACLLAADELVEDLPLDFQAFLKDAHCVDDMDQMVNPEMIFVAGPRHVDALRKVYRTIRQASALLASQLPFQMALIHHLIEPLDDLNYDSKSC